MDSNKSVVKNEEKIYRNRSRVKVLAVLHPADIS